MGVFSPWAANVLATVLVLAAGASAADSQSSKYWRNLSRVIDPTAEPFNADPSGVLDSTLALQGAVDFAMHTESLLLLPLGVYRVTDTINMSCVNRANDSVWQGEVLGSKSANQARLRQVAPSVLPGIIAESGHEHHRPIIYLAPGTPGFGDAFHPRYVLFFLRTNLCTHNCSKWTKGGSTQPNGNFNQVLRGVDVHVARENPGSIAVRHRAAQMSAIEDVDIVLDSGLIGLEGLPGAGGSIANVQIIGGHYGIDARVTQPTSVLTGVSFHGQRCAAIVYDGQFGQQTLVGVGVHINITEESETGVGIWVPGDELPAAWPSVCNLLPFGALPHVPPGASSTTNISMHDAAGEGWVSLVDSSAVFSGRKESSCALVATYTSCVLNNVFIANCATAVQFVGTPKTAGTIADVVLPQRPLTLVVRAVVGVQSNPTVAGKGYQGKQWCPVKNQSHVYAASIYTPERQPAGTRLVVEKTAAAIPIDLQARHLWDEFQTPSVQSRTLVNVQQYGAIGDGTTDDTAALQRLFDQAETEPDKYSESAPLIVFFPAGVYLVNDTLRMPERVPTALVGVAHMWSRITSTDSFGNQSTRGQVTDPIPLLRTGLARTWLHGISVGTSAARGAPYRYPLLWRSQDRESSWRHTRTALYPPKRPGHAPQCVPVPFPEVIFAGNGRVQNWMNDEGCTSACGLEQRMLLIINATDLRVYMMDPEHDSSRAHVELRDSTNITIFGIKAEGNHPVVWAENASFVSYGFGGMASADELPGDTLWPRALFILSGGCNATLFSLPTREVCRNDSFPAQWSVVYHQRDRLVPGRPPSGGRSTAPLDFPAVFSTGHLELGADVAAAAQ